MVSRIFIPGILPKISVISPKTISLICRTAFTPHRPGFITFRAIPDLSRYRFRRAISRALMSTPRAWTRPSSGRAQLSAPDDFGPIGANRFVLLLRLVGFFFGPFGGAFALETCSMIRLITTPGFDRSLNDRRVLITCFRCRGERAAIWAEAVPSARRTSGSSGSRTKTASYTRNTFITSSPR